MPNRYVRQQAVDIRTRENGAYEISSTHSTETRIMFSCVLPFSITLGVVDVLCLQQRSTRIGAVRVVNTNRKVASQAFSRNLEFTRCVAMGKETKCNA